MKRKPLAMKKSEMIQKKKKRPFNASDARALVDQARKPYQRAARYFWEKARGKIEREAKVGKHSVVIWYKGKASADDIKKYALDHKLGFKCTCIINIFKQFTNEYIIEW